MILNSSKQLMEIFIQILKLPLLTHFPLGHATQPWLCNVACGNEMKKHADNIFGRRGFFRRLSISVVISMLHANSKRVCKWGKNLEEVIFPWNLCINLSDSGVEIKTCWLVRIFSFLSKVPSWILLQIVSSQDGGSGRVPGKRYYFRGGSSEHSKKLQVSGETISGFFGMKDSNTWKIEHNHGDSVEECCFHLKNPRLATHCGYLL